MVELGHWAHAGLMGNFMEASRLLGDLGLMVSCVSCCLIQKRKNVTAACGVGAVTLGSSIGHPTPKKHFKFQPALSHQKVTASMIFQVPTWPLVSETD